MAKMKVRKALPLLAPRVAFAWVLWISLLAMPATVYLTAVASHTTWKFTVLGATVYPVPVLAAIAALLIPTGVVVNALLARRLRRRLARHADALCLRCHYPLSPELPEQRCPECGQVFDLTSTRTAWQRWREGAFDAVPRPGSPPPSRPVASGDDKSAIGARPDQVLSTASADRPTEKPQRAAPRLLARPRLPFAWLRWLALVLFVASLASSGLVAKPAITNLGRWMGLSNPDLAFFLVVCGLLAIIGVAYAILSRRLRRRLTHHRDHLCLRCQYPLPDGSEWGTCSECGQHYKLEHTRVVWQRWREGLKG